MPSIINTLEALGLYLVFWFIFMLCALLLAYIGVEILNHIFDLRGLEARVRTLVLQLHY